MFSFFKSAFSKDVSARLTALDKSQAVIEFKMDGTILDANSNFLSAMGYTLDEIKGKHHSLFVDAAYKESAEYREFWANLNQGKYQAAEYKRFGKGGKEIWIQASYNPIIDSDGRPVKVVKYATDVSETKMRNANYEGQLAAVNKAQAVIEFDLKGIILEANENFLGAVGYTLDEIKGKHHSLFVDAAYKESAEYKQFWNDLGQGKYQAAQYKRFGKGGKEIWIQASYNPIMDMNGRPFKVVKYATDITAQILLVQNVKKLIDENVAAIDQSVTNVTQQTSSAAIASMQTLTDVQSVASAAEELSASVREISSSMNKSRSSADEAFNQAVGAENETQRLAESAHNMTVVVELIQNIANQINLLSLNATIESARAGEAGKGFAVVAGEVKNLAKQAADATEQITREISGIQSISSDVVKALTNIKKSVETVREQVNTIAAAVEEQSAVTQEMSSTMQSASQSVASINDNVSQIGKAAHVADHAVRQTQDAARTLS